MNQDNQIILPTPIPVQVSYNISSYTYNFMNLTFSTSATIQLFLLDASGNMRKPVTYILEGEEYKNWGGDDAYLINLLNSKMPEFTESLSR